MKHVKKIISLSVALGLLGGAVAGASVLREKKVAKAETDITVNADFLCYHKAIDAENWTAGFDNDSGTFDDENATFWPGNEAYPFNSMGAFFRGESRETWQGILKSRDWSQTTPYGYFTWSAQNNSENVYITFFYDNGAGHSGSLKLKNNAFVENTMMLWYFRIDGFVADSTYTMHVELYDNSTSGYAFNNFGYLHVNQTEEQVSDAMRLYLNSLKYYFHAGHDDHNNANRNKRSEIAGHYYTNNYLSSVFLRTVSNIDEDFEDNNLFLKHWFYDWGYDNYNLTEKHFDKIISTFAYRPDDGHNVPFNNDGGYFKGWYAANTDSTGFTETDGAIYRFRSRPFVLNNLGLISIKMAGRAASLHVIDVETNSVLAWVDVNGRSQYKDSGDMNNIALSGFNTCTMTNYVINLEAYAGRTIQLAIADVFDSGWAASYFDSLVTSYSSLADFGFKVDVAAQTVDTTTTYALYEDYYVSSTWSNSAANGIAYDTGNSINTTDPDGEGEQLPIRDRVDSSAFSGAYNVWVGYLDAARNGKEGANYCSAKTSDEVKDVIAAYNLLSDNAKRIVCNSDDFERVGEGNWYSINPTIYGPSHAYSIGSSIAYLAKLNAVDVVVYSNSLIKTIDSVSMVVVIIPVSMILIIIAVSLYIFNKKRKENN